MSMEQPPFRTIEIPTEHFIDPPHFIARAWSVHRYNGSQYERVGTVGMITFTKFAARNDVTGISWVGKARSKNRAIENSKPLFD